MSVVREALAERPVDPDLGLPVPFALEDAEGRVTHDAVVRRRAIQCALSRICGVCGDSLDWPVAFVGSTDQADDATFTFPPSHVDCAREALARYAPLRGAYLGQAAAPARWALVTTGGFDLERPASRTGDQRVKFHPNSVSGTEVVEP